MLWTTIRWSQTTVWLRRESLLLSRLSGFDFRMLISTPSRSTIWLSILTSSCVLAAMTTSRLWSHSSPWSSLVVTSAWAFRLAQVTVLSGKESVICCRLPLHSLEADCFLLTWLPDNQERRDIARRICCQTESAQLPRSGFRDLSQLRGRTLVGQWGQQIHNALNHLFYRQ